MPTFLESSVEIDALVRFLKINLQFKEFYQKILSQRIINHAAQERGITVTLEEIQAEANRMRHEKRLEKASDTMAWLADQMITPEDWEEGIRDRLLSEKMAEYLFAKEVEKLFVQNRLNFDQISIYQILVYDESLAQEIFYQIEEKEISFYEAANLYDLDDKRRLRFGYEGPIDRWKLKPDIAAVVFGAKLGEVIGPLPIEQGYYLIMVEEFIPAELTPQRYQEILDGMFQEWLTSELNYMLHSQTL